MDGVLAAMSLVAALAYLRAARAAGRLGFLEDEAPASARVSVVVAAKDEGDHVTEALGTFLGFEEVDLVAVDDRSTDDTGARLRALAGAHPEVQATRVEALPAGWLGKPHALARGAELATGEWLLFTDADVHVGPSAIARAVGAAERAGLDHLTVVPAYRAPSRLVEILSSAASGLLLAGTRAHEVGVPGRRAFLGIGAFNLVRRSTWARSEGFAWLRAEVLDDMGVALCVQRAGGRSGVRLSRGAVALTWYRSAGEMARGLEKVFLAGARYSPLRLLVQAILLALLAVGWPLGLAVGGSWVRGIAVAALSALVLLAARRRALLQAPLHRTLLGPLGQLGLALMMVRAAAAAALRRAVVWRGTRYPLADLRAGQRVWRRANTQPWPEAR